MSKTVGRRHGEPLKQSFITHMSYQKTYGEIHYQIIKDPFLTLGEHSLSPKLIYLLGTKNSGFWLRTHIAHRRANV